MSRLLLLAALLSLVQAPDAPVRPLYAGGPIHDALAGGGQAVFAIEVPAGAAARVVVRQEGVDVGVTLRRKGSDLPRYGLDFVSGPDGEEVAYPAILDPPAPWTVTVTASLPRATRGGYTIVLELQPADERSRLVASAWALHEQAWQDARIGDGPGYQRALDGYAAAAGQARAAGDLGLEAESTFQSALTLELLGRTGEAVPVHRRALEIFRQLGRSDREVRVLNRIGDQLRKVGEILDGERYMEEALQLARTRRDPVALVEILNNYALIHSTLGHFESAIQEFQAALPLAKEVNAGVTELAIMCNIAENYRMLGVYDKSVETYQQALVLAGRLEVPRRTGRTLYMLAETYIEIGDGPKAARALRDAIPLYEQSGDRTGLAITESLLGRVLLEAGDGDAAVAIFQRVLPILRAAEVRGATSVVLRLWASVEIDRGEVGPALERLDEALAINRAGADPDFEAQTQYVRALAFRKTGRSDEALAAVGEAVRITESMRSMMQRTELRSAYLAMVRRYFDLSIELLQERGDAAAAFQMSERGRARTLLDGLAESAAKIQKGVDPALLARERTVQERLNVKEGFRARVALADGEKSPRAIAAGQELATVLDQWNGLRAEIRASSPAYWALQQPHAVSAADVQRTLLDAGSALVEYHLGRDASVAWVIDRDAVTSYNLPAAGAIDALARRYHAALSRDIGSLPDAARRQARQDAETLGRRLAAAVWTPLEPRVRGKRVVIVADGALQYVPFAALPTASGDPLLAHHEIVYLPSASVLETLRRESRPIAPGVAAAVFADPVFSKNDPRFGAARDAAAPARSRASDGGLYGRLQFSRLEADAIVKAAPASFKAVDFDASKSAVTTRDLRKYRILHFATHGSLNTAQPELSGLVFSLVDRAGKPVDGFLRLHEIYNLDLDADLVVLSACRTALGKEVHGEGLIGLTRGFMYAGATRVVSSVWNVDDRASSQLMSRFYAAMLSRGMTPAAALREAQLSMLREPRWADPYYWAAFSLQGEWK